LLAWGSHQEAAKLSGISAKQVFAPAYFGLGFLASLASLMEFRNFDRSQFHEAGDIGLLALSALIIGGLALRRQRYVVNAVLSGVIFVAALELLWATQFQNQASFYAVLGVLVSLGVIVKR
jgi:ribose/xylose/arabinose/galactoside ABC-type transport system permease subunit